MLSLAKHSVRRTLRRFGYDFRRIEHFGEPTLMDFMASREIDLVIDVGANEGQFALELRGAGYVGEIVSFEPIGDVFAKLQANAGRDRQWTARRLALGDKPGRALIDVTELSVFSSMRPQSARLNGWHPGTKIIGREDVEVSTLDSVFGEYEGRRVFLKIDTQGYEQRVLEGASASLGRVLAVQMELTVEHFYEGVWSLTEAAGFMERAGFAIAQVRPVVYLEDHASLGEIDCVFRRVTHQK